jgi:hypothetical protein
VDAEGGVVWTQEYLRYRVNQCDHPTSVQKVFSQIDGGGVSPTCFVPPCIFTVTPTTQSVPAAGGTFTAIVTKTSGDCSFSAESLGSFVTLVSGTSGSAATTTLTYTVAPSSTGPRSTQIRIRWTNNSTLLEINQGASAGSFTLTDPQNSVNPAFTCLIRTASTPCVLQATGNVTAGATFTWTVSYTYGITPFTHTQSGASSSFTFNQSCGGSGATSGGSETALNVTLTVNDANGTTTTTSGSGGQPPLTITFFTC